MKLTKNARDRIERCYRLGRCTACLQKLVLGQSVRNMHRACYDAAMYRIRNGETTLDELEARGEMGPEGKRGRKPKTEYARTLAKRAK